MSAGEFEDLPLPLAPEDMIKNIVEELDQSQSTLFIAIEDCVKNPTKRSAASFNTATEGTREVFSQAIGVIAACDELSLSKRADHIATLCISTEANRLDFLRDIAPTGDFQDTNTSHEELSTMARSYFEEDMEASDIADELTDSYARNYRVDMEELFDSAEPSIKTKARFLAREAGEHALEIGKMSIAVAIGTVLARKALKKLGD